MKLFLCALLLSTPVCLNGFVNTQFVSRSSTASYSLPSEIVGSTKDELLSFAKEQNVMSRTGVFISDKESKKQFKKLTAELEAVCENPTESSQSLMLGDWKLLCTIATPTEGISARLPKMEKKKAPFGLPLPTPPEFLRSTLDPLQDKVRKSVEVIQRIRQVEDNDSDSNADILNRVDNVIQFSPFSVDDIFDSFSLNLNPLEVSKSKVALIHSAKVQSVSPVLRTKLVLKSVVLTVAGTSQYLEPEGADVLGLNVPLGDLFNFGSFDTTYVDEDIRVSRGKVGMVEQLRVFERVAAVTDDEDVVDESDEVEDVADKAKMEVEEEMGKVFETEIETDEVEDVAEETTKEVEEEMEEVENEIGTEIDDIEESTKEEVEEEKDEKIEETSKEDKDGENEESKDE